MSSGSEGKCEACVKAFVHPKVMAVTNFLNALLIGLVGVFYFIFLKSTCPKGGCISDVLCGFYCVVNGLIMINFSTGIIPWLDKCNRKNFGFMYTFYGRFLFIIFAGSLCFGLKDPSRPDGDESYYSHWLGILTGTLSWISGLFNVWALCNYPEYSIDRGGMLIQQHESGTMLQDMATDSGNDGNAGAAGQAEFGSSNDNFSGKSSGGDFGNDNPFA